MTLSKNNKKNWIPKSLGLSLEKHGFVPEESIILKHNKRAKRMSLRIKIKDNIVYLTFPASATYRQAHDFLDSQQNWVMKQLKETKNQTIALEEGGEIYILGIAHTIVSTGKSRGLCYRENGKLYVSGAKEHLPRRIKDYLTKEAIEEITWRANKKAIEINKKILRIRVADTTTRWGSCSSKGSLSFSWRLILAPEDKLDYVVAHEVAHLKHMNHSQKFWNLCHNLTDADVNDCRKWFRTKGRSLFSYKL